LTDRDSRDESLMQAAGRGDLAAFDEIVRRHQTWAWRVAYRFLGHEDDAADVVQDAFLRLLDAAGRYRPSAGFRTYLYRIVSRLCLDQARKRRPFHSEELRDLPNPGPDAGELTARGETGAMVRRALDNLPPAQRLAVVLKYYEGLSYAEIAGAMRITVKAVERLLSRARRNLRSSLAHLEGDRS